MLEEPIAELAKQLALASTKPCSPWEFVEVARSMLLAPPGEAVPPAQFGRSTVAAAARAGGPHFFSVFGEKVSPPAKHIP